MKIIFAGTPHFAAKALETLLDTHEVVAVLTQPDRPAGRGMKLAASPVKQLAMAHDIPVFQPTTLKNAEVQANIAAFNSDVMVVAAYGLILPQSVLQIPSSGCLNIHASLLPRWRGAAPIQRAILAGDSETGITIMQMDEGLDTGDILLKKSCAISKQETAQTLLEKLEALGAEAILETLQQMQFGQLKPKKQDSDLATYAAKLTKEEAIVDWSKDAVQLERDIRGYIPFPVASTKLHGTPIKIIHANIVEEKSGLPGLVLSVEKGGILVATGKGALRLELLQKPGGKPVPTTQFIQSFPIKAGDRFVKE